MDKLTTIAPSLTGYSPRIYRDHTITHESDGYWRVYLGTVQRGWARRLKDARGIVDRFSQRLPDELGLRGRGRL